MSRKWNGKALVDELATRLWDVSDANKERVITWINEIQDDIVSDTPLDFFKFKLKKLLPLEQEIMSMNIDAPIAPTVAIASGGTLVEDYNYKVLVTFLIWDEDQKNYMESEAGVISSEVTGTASDGTIDISVIPTMTGDSSVNPAHIYRRIYLMTQTDASGASYSEPFFVADIEDNTTTTLSVTAPSDSTISPPSDSELDQISSDNPWNQSLGKYLERQDMDDIRRYNPAGSNSASPSYFDYVGTDRIKLYPKLSSGATEAQRTFNYFVYRRPHEVFYTKERSIDMPITFKKAIIEGVLWKGYEFRDRDGHVSKLNNYMNFKKEAINKLRRLKNRPSVVRDVTGDTFGYEV
ncbi:MAG: hypothetical protein CL529_12100 [Aequorivita sp.]|nr:hypothetical protein [Aequorivita sp.]